MQGHSSRSGQQGAVRLALSGFLFENGPSEQSVSFPEFCRIARDSGYTGVELRESQVDPQATDGQLDELGEMLAAFGLTVSCLTARRLPVEAVGRRAAFDRYLAAAHRLGAGLLKVSGDAAWLHWAAVQAAAQGLLIATNTHIGTAAATTAGAVALVRDVAHPAYGILYDGMHLALGGEDDRTAVPALFPFVRNVLVQCLRPATPGDTPTLTHAGRSYVKALIEEDGLQDWPRTLRSFRALGYDGWITVVENGWPVERREFVAAHTATALRRLWAEAGESA